MGGGIGLTIQGITGDSPDTDNVGSSGNGVAIIAGVAAISVGTTLIILSSNNKKRQKQLPSGWRRLP